MVARHSSLVIGLVVAGLLVLGCGGGGSEDKPPSAAEKKKALVTAKQLYGIARAYSNLDLARGPCIGNRISELPDWVVDIAHDPRRAVDELPRNQCRRYREGKAHHVVELDPAGKLIRAQ